MADDKVILDAALELLRIKGTDDLKAAVAEVRAALAVYARNGHASNGNESYGFVLGEAPSLSLAEAKYWNDRMSGRAVMGEMGLPRDQLQGDCMAEMSRYIGDTLRAGGPLSTAYEKLRSEPWNAPERHVVMSESGDTFRLRRFGQPLDLSSYKFRNAGAEKASVEGNGMTLLIEAQQERERAMSFDLREQVRELVERMSSVVTYGQRSKTAADPTVADSVKSLPALHTIETYANPAMQVDMNSSMQGARDL